MPIPQVSVYLDNRPGSLSEAIAQLDKNQIRIFALSIAEAGEFGLVRMITENPGKATGILEDVDYNLAKSRKNTEVTAVFITNEDKISKITKILADGNINIEYAYSSAVHVDGKIALILRANDIENAEKILKSKDITVLSLTEIKKYFQ
ncbi:hypothetical protein E2P63_07995 [Candidatus Bathyarchaeota archaeon]|jgi:hypothetical protein|nr:hypothetical protein E2P63_07995 [Candidatus Bathyarchaeota archaeon]